MTNKLQADVSPRHIGVYSVAGACHLCRARGLASQAAGGPGQAHPAPDRSASSAGHQLGCLMRGNGLRPPPPWEPGLPFQGGRGLCSTQCGSQQCASPSEPPCPCFSAAAWWPRGPRGEIR